jgi:hypothetical protein
MSPDELKQAWQGQSAAGELKVDADLVLREVRRNQQSFNSVIFWRDMLEVSVGVSLVPTWLFLGARLSLPWSWYLSVPAIIWVIACFLVERVRHAQRLPPADETLRQCLERSLADVEHQIWLLRNILWWYILPPALTAFTFVSHVAWLGRSEGWLTFLVLLPVFAVMIFTFWGIYSVNQNAVRTKLEPRRQELLALLASLKGPE